MLRPSGGEKCGLALSGAPFPVPATQGSADHAVLHRQHLPVAAKLRAAFERRKIGKGPGEVVGLGEDRADGDPIVAFQGVSLLCVSYFDS